MSSIISMSSSPMILRRPRIKNEIPIYRQKYQPFLHPNLAYVEMKEKAREKRTMVDRDRIVRE